MQILSRFLKPIDIYQPNPKESYSIKYQRQVPSSFCYYIKCFDNTVYSQDPIVFVAKTEKHNVAQIFVDSLIQDIKYIYKWFKFPKEMIFTKDDTEKYALVTTCHICKDKLINKDKDHCHFTRKFRDMTYNKCNLNYKVPKFIPVILPNLSRYDSHLFIKKLRGKINCIPNNDEKYISFNQEVVVVNKK